MKKKTILFLCTGNSCRSQMAEGWANHLIGENYRFYSAGIETHGVNPNAIKVMAEVSVNISFYQSKTVADLAETQIDLIFTLCNHANESCPVFQNNTKIIHKEFDDPPKLAKMADSEEQALQIYCRVRDEIKAFIVSLEEYI